MNKFIHCFFRLHSVSFHSKSRLLSMFCVRYKRRFRMKELYSPRALLCLVVFIVVFLLVLNPNDNIISKYGKVQLSRFAGRLNAKPVQNTSDNLKKWIVVTSVNNPTQDIIRLSTLSGWNLVVVADSKTPSNWSLPGVHFLSVQEQNELGLSLPSRLPFKSYTRKNIGYLYAIMNGAEWIYDTDDDNKPYALGLDQFDYTPTISGLRYRAKDQNANISERLFNPYRFYGNTNMWPRGFPLEYLSGHTNGRDRLLLCHETITPAVQQGMVHKDPDVDAIYRLLNADRNSGLTKRFNRFAPAITLESGTYAPWNSQNTLFNRKAFFTMMLPTTVEFRVTDIWRSFFAQKMLHLIGEEVAFYPANAVQFRNAHDYLEDFDDERAVYLKSGEIIEFIHGWECFESTTSDCVLALAAEFRNRGFIDDADVSMYSAWIDDLTSIGYHFPPLVNVSRIYDDDSVNTVLGNCRAAGLELVTDMTENITEPQMERARQKMENFGDLLEWCGGENHNFTEHDKNTERSFFSPSQLAVLHSKMENLTNKHETVLLVTFNYPMKESIGVLQRLYEPFFALTVFCGTWNPNTYNYGEALPGIKFPLNFIYLSKKEMLRGYFAYYCLSKINDMRLQNIKGFYAISDDSVFNIWNGTPLDKVVQAGGFAGSPGGEFWWRTKWGPKAALKSVSLFEQKYANDSKVQEIWSEAQRRVFSKNISSSAQELLTTFTGHTIADFFYVPQYELNFLAGMIEIFREAEYFHELVSTKLMELASEKSLRMPNFASLWGKRRNIWDNIYSSDLIMLHPVKLSRLKNNLGKKKFCRTIIGTFRENLYP